MSIAVVAFQLVAAIVCLAFAGKVTGARHNVIADSPTNNFERGLVTALTNAQAECCVARSSYGCAWLQVRCGAGAPSARCGGHVRATSAAATARRATS